MCAGLPSGTLLSLNVWPDVCLRNSHRKACWFEECGDMWLDQFDGIVEVSLWAESRYSLQVEGILSSNLVDETDQTRFQRTTSTQSMKIRFHY